MLIERRARRRCAGVPVIYIQRASDKVLPFGSADWQLHSRLHPGEGDLIVHKQQGRQRVRRHISAPRTGSAGRRKGDRHGPGDPRLRQGNVPGALALGYAVVLAGDAHSSYSKDAARLIEEWNRKLGAAGAQVLPLSRLRFAGETARTTEPRLLLDR